MNSGRHAAVEAEAGELVSRHLSLGPAWKLYGAALLFQGKDAVRALQTAVRLLPDDAEAHLYLGQALHDRADPTGAAASYRRALSFRPDFAEAHDGLGLALQDLGTLNESVASYRRAIEIKPRYAEALGNLGNALTHLGQYEAAAESYRRMLKINPQVTEAHHNLGNALLALGRRDAAAASYGEALALEPEAVETLVNLGNVLRDLGRAKEAAACCRRALALQPDLAVAHRYLGNALFDLGQLDEAQASYGQALAIDPGLGPAHAALGMLYRQIGRTAAAEESCRRALAIEPESAETLALLGDICADRGDFREAEAHFRRALAIDPDLPQGWAGLARYRKMGPEDAAWLTGAQRVLGKALNLQNEITLRYAVGKYFDDVRDFDQAFANYRLANELTKKRGMAYDRQKLVRRVDRKMETYDSGWLRKAQAQANPSQRPVFVLGMPRSGTTLAEQILASHPDAFGAGELRFWHSASARYETSLAKRAAAQGSINTLAAEYLEHLARLSADALRIVDKMPANTMNLGLIHAALPNARVIHVKRHPIDTCLSIYFQVFSATHSYANDLEDIAHYYTQTVRVMQHWRSTLPEGAILEVPYEELVEEPEAWSRKMLEFVGLPWDPRCLDFDRTARTVVTASNWQVRQKISKSSVGRRHHYEKFLGPLRRLESAP